MISLGLTVTLNKTQATYGAVRPRLMHQSHMQMMHADEPFSRLIKADKSSDVLRGALEQFSMHFYEVRRIRGDILRERMVKIEATESHF